MNVSVAFPVHERSQVSEPRRTAARLAERIGFSEERAGKLALVVSELATNLAKHGREGELLLRPLPEPDWSGDAGVEVLAIDRGPGIPDIVLSRRDGYSTSGTLGHGLGAIERQSDRFEIYSHRTGTLTLARVWRQPPRPGLPDPRIEVGAIHVAKTGEDVCGDEWSWRLRDERLAIMIADGLGHGLHAYEAARAAITLFEQSHDEPPGRLIDAVHAALRASRGAAVAMLAVDLTRGIATYSGLGNISSTILPGSGTRTNLVSQNGTAGHSAPRVQEFHYPVPPGSMIVMHSDGLGTHWDLSSYPGLLTRDPSLIAGVLYRDYSRRRDDVTVVVAKDRAAARP
jgi:anti-sigma regulatory factor (Ser/Thr protein kinase)